MNDDRSRKSWLTPRPEDLEVIQQQEELEKPLLEGRWLLAAKALEYAMTGADRQNAEAFLTRCAAAEHDKRPMLRVKAARAETTPRAFPLPIRRDRIVHNYEWQGEVLVAHWQAGFFQLRSRHFSERVLTLTGVQFSHDDLEALIGASMPPSAEHQAGLTSDVESENTFKGSDAKRLGRPPGSGSYHEADLPLLAEMQQLIADQIVFSVTSAAKEVVSKAVGAGTEENKIARLRKAYKAAERNGAK